MQRHRPTVGHPKHPRDRPLRRALSWASHGLVARFLHRDGDPVERHRDVACPVRDDEGLDEGLLDGDMLHDMLLPDGMGDLLEARVAVRKPAQTLAARLRLARRALLDFERHLSRRRREPLPEHRARPERHRVDGGSAASAQGRYSDRVTLTGPKRPMKQVALRTTRP
jgi:hypothetical protein